MNLEDARYNQFGLVRDMMSTSEIIRGFDPNQAALAEIGAAVAEVGRLFMTGEGSSRIFPAKSAMQWARQQGLSVELYTEGGRQAREYDLSQWAVFALSNSGRTAEVIQLFDRLAKAGLSHLYSLTAFEDTELEKRATRGCVLTCGKENAVAATKSVIEQALFYLALLEHASNNVSLDQHLAQLANDFQSALTVSIDPSLIEKIANAGIIYWAGRNDGVAEELTLKTNEITRKPADFLEGTYAVHGVEEVMNADDVVIWVDPYPESESKFHEVLVEGVGLTVIAISTRATQFSTIQIPDACSLQPFVSMAAGWNIMVDVGVSLNINLDKPERARKVGNEFNG